MSKAAFPSSRQAKCAGLRRGYYRQYLRDLIDYDYDEQLPEEARVWLAAFTEEYYRGWSLKRETQVLPKEMRRAANAVHSQRLKTSGWLNGTNGKGWHEFVDHHLPPDGVEERMVRALDQRASLSARNATAQAEPRCATVPITARRTRNGRQ